MDLISRQAVVEAIDHHTFNTFDGLCLDEDITVILEEIPSAQPELDEWCEDCKEYDAEKHCCPRWNRVIRDAVKQTQIIRCKDCGYYKTYTLRGITQGFCNRLGLQAMETDDYCSRAERGEHEARKTD